MKKLSRVERYKQLREELEIENLINEFLNSLTNDDEEDNDNSYVKECNIRIPGNMNINDIQFDTYIPQEDYVDYHVDLYDKEGRSLGEVIVYTCNDVEAEDLAVEQIKEVICHRNEVLKSTIG